MSTAQRSKSNPETTDAVAQREDLELKVSDLRKSFISPLNERLEVLRGITFSAKAGETMAIMGPSAAGKSTLLHLLGGLDAPDHGTIVLGSFDIDSASSDAIATFRAREVGFVFQFHYLLPDLTAVENVALPMLMARTGHREAISRATEALESTGLGSRSTDRPAHLSGGEQQRVAVCRALITRPSIVLADEPTGNLDESFVEKIGETLISYSRTRPAIVVIATHNHKLAKVCDRVLTLTSGKVSETGTPV